MKVKAVYDNGGKTMDRYTVYYDVEENVPGQPKRWMCLGMNAAPFHPQGIGMHGSGVLGRHNGKRVRLEDLPVDCQQAVKNDLTD